MSNALSWPHRCVRPALFFGAFLLPRCALAQTPPAPPQETPSLTGDELSTLTSGPTPVTLSGKDLPVGDVMNLLLASVGLPAAQFQWGEAYPKTPKTISVDWKNVPFWTAARDFENLTGLVWREDQTKGLTITRESTYDASSSNGVLGADTPLVKVAGISIDRNSGGSTRFDLPTVPQSAPRDSIAFNFRYYLDPKLNLELGSMSIANLRISNDPEPIPEMALGSSTFSNKFPLLTLMCSVGLPGVLHSGDVIATMSGVLRAKMASSYKLWKVADIYNATGAKNVVGTVGYVVEEVRFENEKLILKVSATRDALPQDTLKKRTPSDSPNISTLLKVKDAEGHELVGLFNQVYVSTTPEGQQKAESEISFPVKADNGQKRSGPYSLEWSLPTALRTLDTPFEFHDVRVP